MKLITSLSKGRLKALPFLAYDKVSSLSWDNNSRLIIKGDGSSWVLSSIVGEMLDVCKELKITTVNSRYLYNSKNQCAFFTSKYEVLMNWTKPRHRIAFPYYHGDPSSSMKFKKMIDNIKYHHDDISRIQVSHKAIEELILNTGIDQDKVHRIPISIDLDFFKFTTTSLNKESRERLGIPSSAVVVGSFQKDGIGWGDGLEPKLIKGPDILLKTLEILKRDIPEIFVLLTGSSRGFVKKGLEKLKIPYKHIYINDYSEIGKYYNALDFYLISSREEGGPRAVLEAFASGVPLVTTRVGQAIDMVHHGENGWIVDVDDYEGLAYWSKYALENKGNIDNILLNGRRLAEDNCYSAQLGLWQDFMRGFVNS